MHGEGDGCMRYVWGAIISVALLLVMPYVGVCEEDQTRDDSGAYFYDRYGDLMLVGRDNDIYIDKIDGSESRKVTSTPDLIELDAFLGLGGRYVLYKTEKKVSVFDKTHDYQFEYFMQKIDDTDLKKTRINDLVYRDIKMQRVRERNVSKNE
jgi:hypothetical protein